MCRHKIGMCESYSPVPCDETVIRDNKVHLAWCQVVTGLWLVGGSGGRLDFLCQSLRQPPCVRDHCRTANSNQRREGETTQ